MVIGHTGDVGRFANRDQLRRLCGRGSDRALLGRSDRSTGSRVEVNRKLNNAIHIVAITQIRQPDSDGRIYFERKVAEGKTKREALRSLKRHVSNAVFRQLVLDAERGPGGH